MSEEVLATVRASGGRRVLGVAALLGLGFLLIYIAITNPPSLGWIVFLIAAGGAAFWGGVKMWQGTREVIELTETQMRFSDGTVLVPVDQIESLDRGFFAFKPSNGFIMKLHEPGPKAWVPGLWWRIGRRVGVGGLTAGSQTKIMADMIATMIATREMDQTD